VSRENVSDPVGLPYAPKPTHHDEEAKLDLLGRGLTGAVLEPKEAE